MASLPRREMLQAYDILEQHECHDDKMNRRLWLAMALRKMIIIIWPQSAMRVFWIATMEDKPAWQKAHGLARADG